MRFTCAIISLAAKPMPGRKLKIEIAKRADGAGLLRCTRPDGSVTWQKQSDRHALHFTMHDLTHFAVETMLGYQRGFFGLIAEGWNVEDTTGKGARGKLPEEAGEVESIVGLSSMPSAVPACCGLRRNLSTLRRARFPANSPKTTYSACAPAAPDCSVAGPKWRWAKRCSWNSSYQSARR
jgi:hypothetical protein